MLTLALLFARLAVQEAPSPPRANAGLAPTLDTTVAVTSATQLRLEASAGRLVVRSWDRSAVRIVVAPASGTTIHLESTPALLSVAAAAGGRVDEAEYSITVPRHMALTLGGGDLAIEIVETEGDVVAKNYSGRISLSRAKGTLSLKSTLGELVVQNSAGRLTAQSLYAPIRITDFVGELNIEGSANHLYLTRVDTRSLNASTVNGVIWFTGPLHTDGRYSLSTHSGSIWFAVPDPVNATFHVSTVSGAFSSTYPTTREEGRRRGRFTVKIGSGAANVDVETFNGGIVVRRPEASTPPAVQTTPRGPPRTP